MVLQRKPFVHGLQVPPPQSTSVSMPFLIPSVQEGLACAPQIWPVQDWVMQSDAARHARPSAQSGQLGPPQSVSVSRLSLTLLEHCAGQAKHALLSQSSLRQSVGTRQWRPSGQRGQPEEPPQSMSDSLASLDPLVQGEACEGWQEPLLQMPLVQSLARLQALPTWQAAQEVPPQSMSDSSPSFALFWQPGMPLQ